MRVLLSTIGSRGDVQPMVALALHLREYRTRRLPVRAAGFEELLDGFGLAFFPVGHDLRLGPRKVPGGRGSDGRRTVRGVARGRRRLRCGRRVRRDADRRSLDRPNVWTSLTFTPPMRR